MNNSNKKAPLIAIISCQKELNGYQIQAVNEFYINTLRAFGALPIVVPAGSTPDDISSLLTMVDGVCLPGSHSNVAPEHYGASHHEPCKDEGRDQLSLEIIRQCVDRHKPILGICRGFQEMNVALGGTLHPKVHELTGYLDHREPESSDFVVKYAPAHSVTVPHGGWFQQRLNGQQDFQVNSLHGQGVDQLASSLTIEATAPDGLIEAFSLAGHPFFVGVQWHPEWQAKGNPQSVVLFESFVSAASGNREHNVE